MRFWQLKNLKEFVETVCLSEKRLFYFYPKASTGMHSRSLQPEGQL